jgi:transposase-like protein
MKATEVSFYEWQKRFSSAKKCMNYLAEIRWPGGFQCPHCGHDHGWYTASQGRYECAGCYRQSTVTSGTLFHATKLPLTKWFWAIYWISSDKGGISALRLSKLIGVSWHSAYRVLRVLRTAMGDRDTLYRLTDIIEFDDALIGGKKPGKRGRGAEGKVSILVACENRNGRSGFLAMEAVNSVNMTNIHDFAARRIKSGQTVRSDALPANNGLAVHVDHIAQITPPEMANEWLPWVHIAIANLKRFLLGTYHGTSKRYLQDYLNEFCYRFNRRFWEAEIPNRLIRLCLQHKPVLSRGTVN